MKNEYLLSYDNELLKNIKLINLELPATNEALEKLKYTSDNCTIVMNFKDGGLLNEKEYYKNVKYVLDNLNTHNKKYNIKFFVDNRKLFTDSNLLDNDYDNMNVIINNEEDDYTISEYKENDRRLDDLIKNIKLETLSPLERFAYVYNIVKKYRQYKEEPVNSDVRLSRNIKYLLDSDYLVCKGYAKLLTVLLNKVGLSSTDYVLNIYEKKDENTNLNNKMISFEDSDINAENELDEKEFKRTPHQRNLVKIDDDKYDVHGIYISDPTLDNTIKASQYNHALITFDRDKEVMNLESLTLIDCLYDFHNKQEFYSKINYLIRYYSRKYDNANDIIKTIFDRLLKYLYRLDYKEYAHFYKKYNNLNYSLNVMDEENEAKNGKNLQSEFENMLEEYYDYVIKYANKEVSNEKIINAYFNSKVILNEIPTDVVDKVMTSSINYNNEREKFYFPFNYDAGTDTIYDPEDTTQNKRR